MSFILHGIPAAHGVAVGTCIVYDPSPPHISQDRISAEAIAMERERLLHAILISKEEVMRLRDHVKALLGEEESAIFDAHLLMLEDEELLAGAFRRIEQQMMNAE